MAHFPSTANTSVTVQVSSFVVAVKISQVAFEINAFSKVPLSTHIEVKIGSTAITQRGSTATVADWRKVARLARIAVAEDEIVTLCAQLNSMLAFVEQLSEVDVAGIEPMTSVTPMAMKMRVDEVTDGGDAEAVLANAPQSEDGFYLVPKVIE